MKKRFIHQIAFDIIDDMRKQYPDNYRQRFYAAMPYLDAMKSLNTIDEMYLMDSAESIVRYCMGNLSTWRGEKAREIKKELKELLK